MTTIDQARVRDILRVLCRIPIHRGQLALYHFALATGDAGFTSEKIKIALHFDQAKHRGLMAALTQRINLTRRETSPEKPGISLLFRQKWDGHQNTYWPVPELLEAIRLLPELAKLLAERTLEQIVTLSPQSFGLPDGVAYPPPHLPPPPPPPPASPFLALCAAMDRAGLFFPSETVANVLLALQVKRFAILTGISGTGKTRIGQALAKSFPVTQLRPVGPSSDAQSLSIEVKPYMLQYNRFILPVVLREQLKSDPATGKVHARFPGGTLDLTTSTNHAFGVLFKDPFRTWFKQTFQEGSRFLVRLAGPEGDAPDTLVFEVPAAFREEPISNLEVVAVRPDWTDHRGLLGYHNPLSGSYVSTPFLDLMLRAHEECQRAEREARPPRPFFGLLDEMNLARVEHYFADFLSALESGEPLALHEIAAIEEGESGDGPIVPRRLAVPPNLFLLGTVNVDESTYLFSPKVLDRAFAIEFDKVDLGGLSSGAEAGSDLDLLRWSGKLSPPQPPGREDWRLFEGLQGGELAANLRRIHDQMARYHRHFGYRVAAEVARFVRLAVEQTSDPEAAAWAALDVAVLQKVLVKLNGTQSDLQPLLEELLGLALVGDASLRDLSAWRLDPREGQVTAASEAADTEPELPRSAAKLWRMLERVRRQGFTSWIE